MSAPFQDFAGSVQPPSESRARITAAYRRPEPDCVAALHDAVRLAPAQADAAQRLAGDLARALRDHAGGFGREGLVQGLIQEFSLSSQEGVALMCLAEALLRIPDKATRDALIRDKIGDADWRSHLGHSGSLFVNAATWGLVITGRLVATHSEAGLGNALARALGKSGEPLIRRGVDMAMRLMGDQFVAGETIELALQRARRREREGFRYSYDMLGEAAFTAADTSRYLRAYEHAIHAIGQASAGAGIYQGPGISIKLSALHPRYSRAQRGRVIAELYPRLLSLTRLARQFDIGLNIDAEEADRLDISLDLLERLCAEPDLLGWNGVGFVVQAYQKRCPYVLDHVIALARRTRRRLMIRLVKGAYWDSEIKRAQVDGLEGYPVYTRKVYTDVAYLACARKLLAAPDAVYPQFATHNAHTLAVIHQLAGPDCDAGQYEFQCLHGMGEPLYERVVAARAQGGLARPCRIYAPVGNHETLLAYLVRRLLENGANTSFVNRVADRHIAIDQLVADPVSEIDRLARTEGILGLPHPAIPLPRMMFGDARENSAGLDLSNERQLQDLAVALRDGSRQPWRAFPIVNGEARTGSAGVPVLNPADPQDHVGRVRDADARDVADALAASVSAAPLWQAMPPAQRADRLARAADLMERRMPELLGLIIREAGKTCANAVAEVREAVDFLRYYGAQARRDLAEGNHRALGPVVCISPWNFPLAIFTGQVAAALAAGNTVLAKPAEQTPLIAAEAVRLLHEAGIPPGAMQLLPGRGEVVGSALVRDARIRGVVFTGSTQVARILQRDLAGRLDDHHRPLPLIAETGGQNAMIVDSSALVEQVVADVIVSAFDSAGQRCSALRVLCVQEDIADRVLAMLLGAMRELRVAGPDRLATDVGPVIDAEAKDGIERHIAAMRAKGRRVHQPGEASSQSGTFVMPTVIELDSLGELDREIFGPVLHVVRYRRDDLPAVVEAIDATGYGLTLGVHSRIDETIEFVTARARAGNQYVNRNMVGAVVGVQPFGGDGLSGTGPKAGGPLYLHRLLAWGPALELPRQTSGRDDGRAALRSLCRWLDADGRAGDLVAACERLGSIALAGTVLTLPGPTGERNTYTLLPREAVLCVADASDDLLFQLAAVLATDGRAVWIDAPRWRQLADRLPADVRQRIDLVADPGRARLDALLIHGEPDRIAEAGRQLARREGPIVGMLACAPGQRVIEASDLARLCVERALSVNTAAAGGNASLMTIG